MEIDLYTDKKNLSLIVGHNGSHKKAYNDLLDKKLDMLQSTLDDLSLENKIGIDKLLKDEEIITIINSQVSEIITEMQDIVKKDHTIMNNIEKMYILD